MKLVVAVAFVLSTLAWSSPAFAGAEELCLSVMKGDIRDRESSYSEQDTFRRYQNLLQTAHFKSYQEMSDAAGDLGIDIPMADAVVGFSAGGKTSSSTFQNEVDQFLNSTYDESRSHWKSDFRKETINGQLLRVVENCHNNYFSSLRDRVGLSTTVDLNDYSSFTITLQGFIPASTGQGLIIQAIEPTDRVHCTENGRPVDLVISRSSQQALMECTKDRDQTVSLRIMTNAGISNLMVLPKPPPPEPPHPAPLPPAPEPPYKWTTALPYMPNRLVRCSCAKVVPYGNSAGFLIVNNCHGPLTVWVGKDVANRVGAPPPPRTPENWFTEVTLRYGDKVDINLDGASGAMGVSSCPEPDPDRPGPFSR